MTTDHPAGDEVVSVFAPELPGLDDFTVAIVESAPDGIILADEHSVTLLVNRQTEAMFGYERTDLLGRSVETLLPDRLKAVHAAHRPAIGSLPPLGRWAPGWTCGHVGRTARSSPPRSV